MTTAAPAAPQQKRRAPICVESFRDAHVPGVRAFNSRLEAGGQRWRFPESPVPKYLAPAGPLLPYIEYFLAVQEGDVRGGYVLKPQAFAFDGSAAHV